MSLAVTALAAICKSSACIFCALPISHRCIIPSSRPHNSLVSHAQEILNPKDLLANPWNPNRLTPEAEMKLENSLARLGMFKPILVRTLEDGRREILGGENRARAAERLGWTEVPVYNLGTLSDDQAKQIGLLDNTRYGHDDASVLAKLLEDLGSPTYLATFMPFDMAELDALSAVSRIDPDKIGLEDEAAPATAYRPF